MGTLTTNHTNQMKEEKLILTGSLKVFSTIQKLLEKLPDEEKKRILKTLCVFYGIQPSKEAE